MAKFEVGDRIRWTATDGIRTAIGTIIAIDADGDIWCNNWSDNTDKKEAQFVMVNQIELVTKLEKALL
jgi:hypothetical protein